VNRFAIRLFLLPLLVGVIAPAAVSAQNPAARRTGTPPPGFRLEEATIADIHRAMGAGRLTARQLVQHYLDRIEMYDKRGPALNSLITLNPNALAAADSLDVRFRRSGLTGPLHGIPVIVKDNYDTRDLPTTAGSLTLAGSIPPDDAFQVRRLREAGAIVLAKSNMAEFAFTPYETVGSMLPGYTKNPYRLDRTTAGSSGGTAAAVAANFGTVGLGTDTGNSIRGPSSHTALVGICSTMGLTSRDGIIPLYLDRDIGGPMARTVADAVAVLDVIAGYDPSDPVTEASRGKQARRYMDSLKKDGLKGARIGIVRQLSNTESTDPEVLRRFEEALTAMRRNGATLVDIRIPELDTIKGSLWCGRFKTDVNAYLASLGPRAPVKNLDEIIKSGKFHPSIGARLRSFAEFKGVEEDPDCRQAATNVPKLQSGVRKVLTEGRLDALVYPTWSNPPRLIGDLNTPHGNNSWQLSPPTGFPAITVPMGYVGDGLPVGLQIFGDAWSEPRLIELAYSFEQATRHRHPPAAVPPLKQ
jgi:Asp-tRNA(Asn)/Glu-tRNA(Gln) amidotransferase A subunit family amidase